jgi:apolipoprotein N-acyltransferase
MRVADWRMYGTWALLATYCSLYFPVGVWLIRRLDRGTRLPLVLSAPLVWCGLEFVRSFLMTGFAWYYLGHSQHAFLPLIQMADLGGVYIISFLVAAVNAWVFDVLCARPVFRTFFGLRASTLISGKRLAIQAVALLAIIGAGVGYGFWRLNQNLFVEGPRVALLQGNLDQRIRNEAGVSRKAAEGMLLHYEALAACAARAPQRPDLIVWPETSFPVDWVEFNGEPPLVPHSLAVPSTIGGTGVPGGAVTALLFVYEQRAEEEVSLSQRIIRSRGPAFGTNVLLGVNVAALNHLDRVERRHCSALLVRGNGMVGGRYDKIHRVPFGEYVPLRDWLPFMNWFAPYKFDYSITPGNNFTRFVAGNHRLGVLICFEDTDPFLARRYVVHGEDGPPVDFLINISNDGWFDGTSEHDEHLAICRFRAVETRRAVARAVNMGISAVIDGNGRVLAPEQCQPDSDRIDRWDVSQAKGWGHTLALGDWWRFKKVQGVLTAIIPIDRRLSLYAWWGDWLGWACLAAVGLGLVWVRFRRYNITT